VRELVEMDLVRGKERGMGRARVAQGRVVRVREQGMAALGRAEGRDLHEPV
jgi:hypothetical protein